MWVNKIRTMLLTLSNAILNIFIMSPGAILFLNHELLRLEMTYILKQNIFWIKIK